MHFHRSTVKLYPITDLVGAISIISSDFPPDSHGFFAAHLLSLIQRRFLVESKCRLGRWKACRWNLSSCQLNSAQRLMPGRHGHLENACKCKFAKIPQVLGFANSGVPRNLEGAGCRGVSRGVAGRACSPWESGKGGKSVRVFLGTYSLACIVVP